MTCHAELIVELTAVWLLLEKGEISQEGRVEGEEVGGVNLVDELRAGSFICQMGSLHC